MDSLFSSLFVDRKKTYYSHWDLLSPTCGPTLVVKKISIAILATLNFAALGGLLYYVVCYTNIPEQALFVSPFIVGALAALSYLKVPTFGINSGNYSTYTNPVYMVGRVGAYVFFGPLMYAIKWIDLTPYHDHIVAKHISKELDSLPFEDLAEKYGNNIDNLIRYGFIHKQYEQELKTLYDEYRLAKTAFDFWNQSTFKADGLPQAKERLELINQKWIELKESFAYNFPYPEEPHYDFSKKVTWARLFIREYFIVGTPLDFFSFKA